MQPLTSLAQPWAGRLFGVLLLIGVFQSQRLESQVVRNFGVRYGANDNGDILIIGNTSMTCQTAIANCTLAQGGGNFNNNNFSMVDVDIDGVAGTFNSSAATLTLPSGSQVLFAGLYWGGASIAAARNQVMFQTPASGGYLTLTATQVDAIAGSGSQVYQGLVDVTSLVQSGGSGSYTVANVQRTIGTNLHAGWAMIVVVRDLTQPSRNLTVFDGFASVTTSSGSVSATVSGFVTPPSGAVKSRVGVVAYEGDLATVGDSLRFNSTYLTDSRNAVNNFFNSTIEQLGSDITTKTPNYVNQLGFDADIVDASGILANGATSETVSLSTGGDFYYPGVITIATDIYAPQISGSSFTKTATDLNGGTLLPGDTVQYDISMTNSGLDPATLVTLYDTIPANATFAAGSMQISSGAGAGTKTDAAGDDQGRYEAGANRIVVNVGSAATATQGGVLGIGSSASIRFQAVVTAPAAAGSKVSNQGTLTYRGQTLGTDYTALTDGDPATAGQQPTTLTVTRPDLAITTSHSGTFLIGVNQSYTLQITNSGTAATSSAITLLDTLPTGLSFVSGTGTGWACAATGQVVSCTAAGSLAVGSSSSIILTVLPAAAAFPSVTNRARVSNALDVNTANNVSSDPTSIGSIPDLSIAKSHTGSFVAGGNAVWSLLVTNGVSGPTTGALTITDTLPAGATYVSATGTGWTCVATGQVVTCTNPGPIAASGTTTVTLTAALGPTSLPSISNTARIATPGDLVTSNNASTDGPTPVMSTVDVAIAKSHSGSITVGSNAVWTLTVSNQSLGATTGTITVTDTLAAGLTFVSGTGASWSCTATGQVVTCVRAAALAPGATSPITLTASVGAAAYPSLSNTARVTTPGDSATTNNSATDGPTAVGSVPDLSIVKSHAGSFTQGTPAVFTLSVSNTSAGPTTGAITVLDTLPTGLSFTSGTGTGWACSATGQVVTCTNPGPIAAAATGTITLTVGVAAAAIPSVTNRARVSTAGDLNTANNVASDGPAAVAGIPDLALTKSHSGNFMVGQTAVYTLKLKNVGTGSTTGAIAVLDNLPTGMSFVSGSGTGFSCSTSGQNVSCSSAGPIVAGDSVLITLNVSVGAAAIGATTNTATVSTPGDASSANDAASDPTTTSGAPDLSLTKSHSGTLLVGQNGVFTIAVTNIGSGASTLPSTVVDTLHAGLTFVSATGAGWVCSASGQVVTCIHALGLAASATSTITLTVSVSAAALPATSNSATVTTSGDLAPGNNTGTDAPVNVTSVPDLSIEKRHTGSFTVGQPGVYTITLTNVAPGPTTGAITVRDTLPTGLTFTSGVGTGWTCSAAGQIVTCTNPGAIAASGVSTITLTVTPTSAAIGSVSNGATVSTPGDLNSSNNSWLDQPTTVSYIDLALDVSHSGNFAVGAAGVYTAGITNTGTTATTGALGFVDTLPTGLTFTSATGTGWSCSAAAQVVSCTSAGPLLAGASTTISLTVGVTAAARPSVINRGHVATPSDPFPANDVDPDPTTVVAPDLSLAKSHSGTFIVAQPGSYTLTVTNAGTGATTGTVTLVDTLPTGLGFTSGTGTGWTCSAAAQIVTCTTPGPIAASASSVLTLSVTVAAAAAPSVTNSATVSTPNDPTAGNNRSTDTPTTVSNVNLTLAKTHTGAFTAGAPGSYLLTVQNTGTTATTAVITVLDTLPAGLSYASAAGTGWSCSAAGQVVSCTNVGPIAGGGSSALTLTVGVAAAAAPTVTNGAGVRTAGERDTTDNGSLDVPTTVVLIDLAAILSHTGNFTVGSPGVFAVGISNAGTGATTGTLTLTDTLPSGLTFTSGVGTGWTCSATGQIVTCTNPGPVAAGANAGLTLTTAVAVGAVPGVTDRIWIAVPNDVAAGNNSASDGVTIGAIDLSLAKTHAGSFTVGSSSSFTLTVTNAGSAATTGTVIVTDTLRTGLGFTGAAGAGWTCSATAQVVSCTNPGPIAASATSAVTLNVTVGAAAQPSLINTAHLATPNDVGAANNDATDGPVAINATDLAVTLSHTGSLVAGQPGVYTIAVSNPGTAATTGGITLTDTLPTGLSYASGTGTGWTCSAAGQIVTCTDPGPIAAGASASAITLTVGVTAAAAPSVTGRATVATANDPNAANNTASDPTTVTVVDLALIATHSGAFTVGNSATITLTATNGGTASTTGAITTVDTLPAGLSFTTATGAGWSCSANGQIVTCTNPGPIAAGASSAVNLGVSVGVAALPSLTNNGHVSTPNDVTAANNDATDGPIAVSAPDLAIILSHGGNFVAGQPGVYTLAVSNGGTAATSGVITLKDTLPAGLTYTSATGTGWACSAAGQIVTCTNPGPLGAGASAGAVSLTVAVTAGAAPSVTNTATVAVASDPNAANDAATDPTTVTVVDLALTLGHGATFTVGTSATLTLTATNAGTASTTGAITVLDTLPAGLTYTSSSGAGWSCSAAGQVVTCASPGPLAASATSAVTLTVAVGPTAAPSVTNTGDLSTPNDNVSANNTASDGPITVSAPDLATTLTHSGNFTVGVPGAYTLGASNAGTAPTTGPITLTDTLPAGLSYTSGSGTGWSCSAVGPVVTCTTAGPLAAGAAAGSVTLTVAVASAAAPGVTNTLRGATAGDPNVANNTANDPTTVLAVDLALVATHSGTFTVGNTANVILTATNGGTASTTGAVTVVDTLPAGLTYTSSSGSGWSCSAVTQIVTCSNPGPIAPSASSAVTLAVAIGGAAVPTVTNIGHLGTPNDVTAANNNSTDGPIAVSSMDLAVALSHTGNFLAGQPGVYIIAVSNPGTAATTGGLTVTDTLPTGLSYTSATGTAWSCSAAGQIVTCTNPGPIAAGTSAGSITLTVGVAAAAAPSITDKATVATANDPNAANNTASDPTTVTVVDLALTATHSGAFTVGNTATITLTATNGGTASTTGVITTVDTLPAGLSFTTATGAGWSCSANGQIVTCTNPGPIAAGASSAVNLAVSVGAAASPQVTNNGHVSTANDIAAANNNATDGPIAVRAPDLAINLSHTGSFVAGQAGVYTLAVSNVGTTATGGVITVKDTLPAGLSFTSAAGTNWTCSAVGQIVTCTNPGPIAVGASASAISLTVGVTAAAAPSVTNSAAVATGNDPNAANNVATDPTTVTVVDLALTLSHGGSFNVGSASTLTLTSANAGTASTNGPITVIDTLPAGLTYTSSSGAGWSCSALGQVVTCTSPGPIAAAASSAVTLSVVVDTGAVPQVTIRGHVSTPNDFSPANNDATDGPIAVSAPDLAVTETHSGNFTVGLPGVYTLGASNVGSAPSTGPITLTDTLPAGLSFTTGTGTGWSCSAAGQIVTCTNPGPLAAGASASNVTLAVTVTSAATPTVTSVVRGSTAGDPSLANNSASDATTVLAVDLALATTHSGTFTVGNSANLILTATNGGTASTSGAITLVDTLPAGLTYTGGTGPGWTCSATGQVVTCSNPGPIAPSASSAVTLAVAIGGAAIPTVTNTGHVSTPNDVAAANNADSDGPIAVSSPDLAVSLTHSGSFTVGVPGSYTLGASNIGTAATSGAITLVDTLPGGLSFTSAAGTGWSCGAAGQVVTCTNPGPIAGAASAPAVTLTVAVAAGAAPSATNILHGATSADPNPANDAASDPTTVLAVDLALTATHSGTFAVGSGATLILTANNAGTAATIGAVSLVDTLPAGLIYAGSSGAGWSCSAAAQVVTCTNAGPMAAGASSAVTLAVNVGAAAQPSVTNVGHVATLSDVNPGNNASTDGPISVSSPDLAVALSHTGNFVAGQPGVYTLSASNAGSSPTTGAITLTDTLPAGLSFSSAVGTGWSCNPAGVVVTCITPGPLAAGASAPPVTLTVAVAAAAAPAVTNSLHGATSGDPTVANNVDSDPTTVTVVDLALSVTHSGTFSVGSSATITLTAANAGSAGTTGTITLIDTLPAGLSYTGSSSAGWNCSAAGLIVTCTSAGPIPAGASSAVALAVTVGSAAQPSVTNIGHVTTPNDVVAANNTATDGPIAVSSPDLTVNLTHSGNFTAGLPGVYTIATTNAGSSATIGPITLTDTLPVSLSFASATGTGWSCSASGQVVTCTSPGPIAAGASSPSITLTVGVSAAAAPSVSNGVSVATVNDANLANDSDTDPTTVLTVDLALSLTHSGTFSVGSSATLTLTSSNAGTASTTGPITVVDTLPAGLTYTGSTGAGWNCSTAGQVVTCSNAGPIAAGGTSAVNLAAAVGTAAAPQFTNAGHVSTANDVAAANNAASDGPIAVSAPDIAVTLTHSGGFTAGLPGSYTLGASNAGSGATTGPIVLTDTLPPGLTFTSATGTGWSCAAAGPVVTCTNPGPLAAGASASPVTLTVAVANAAAPSVTNTLHGLTAGDPNVANNSASDPTVVTAVDLAIDLSHTGIFPIGGTGSYTMAVTNAGTAPTNGVITLTDSLPAGLTYSAATGTGWSCSAMGPVVTCTNPGPLAAGASAPVTLTVQVGPAAASGAINIATVATSGDANAANDRDTDATAVATPDLALTKSHTGSFVAGTTGSYTLSVTNGGGGSTSAITTVIDTLPGGLTFVSGTGPGWTCGATGQVSTCTHPTPVAPGATSAITLTVNVTAATPASVTNIAHVSTPTDTSAANNTGTDAPTTVTSVDLALSVTSTGTFAVGGTAGYSLAVSNVGSAATTGPITVTDTLPAGLTFVAGSGTGWSCTASGPIISCTSNGALGAGTASNIALIVAVGATAYPGVTNTAHVRTGLDFNLANDAATAGPTSVNAINLAVTKSHSGIFRIGQTGHYTLSVRNSGGLTTTGAVVLRDTLPNGLSYLAATGTGWSCVAAGSTVSCTNPAPIAGGQTSAVQLDVAVALAAAPSVTNVAHVATPGDVDPADDISRDPTQVAAVDLSLSKRHSGTFTVGQPGMYTLAVSNVGSGPTIGTIALTDTLPVGLSYASAAGAGWSCSAAAQVVSCTNPDTLAAGDSTVLALTVGVAQEAFPSVVNTASVSTPFDDVPGNNTAVDQPTSIIGRNTLFVDKAASKVEVEIADVLDYTIRVKNVGIAAVSLVSLDDRLPRGFTYETGTARLDTAAIADPTGGKGPALSFALGTINPGATVALTYRVKVGAGAALGDLTNRALATSPQAASGSNVATASVVLRGGVFTDRAYIAGKVYLDHCACDSTALQGPPELGVPGVRLYLEDGTSTVTDVEGKYHFYDVSPRLHVVKLDVSTLPASAALQSLSHRDAGDADSRFADVKTGELYRADFALVWNDSVYAQLLARRERGEVSTAITGASAGALSLGDGRAAPGSGSTLPPSSGGVPSISSDPYAAATGDAEQQASEAVVHPNDPGAHGFQGVLPGRTLTALNSNLPALPTAEATQSISGFGSRGHIELEVTRAGIPADGHTAGDVVLRIVNSDGEALTATATVTLEASAGRWDVVDRDETEPGIQITVDSGIALVHLIAPDAIGQAQIRATSGDLQGTTSLTFIAASRPLLAAGVVEARLDFHSRKLAAGERHDAFESDLTSLDFSNDSGTIHGGARGAVFLKGTLLDHYQMTLRYDSEHDDQARLFRDIRPEEFYPVYGDASIMTFNAQSTSPLYARVDRDRSFALYGDFLTSQGGETRALGAYNRSLTGTTGHYESDKAAVNVFASRNDSHQVVDEIRGLGLSGPYPLSRPDALLNSEHVEILVRDRNQPATILDTRTLNRFEDYTVEPLTGRLIFKTPVPSLDENLNPVSIRVSYEVESGGDRFWVYGADVQVTPINRLELGASVARDQDPLGSRTLASANATIRLAARTFLFGEFARADSASATSGNGERIELRHFSTRFEGRAYALQTDAEFSNQSSAIGRGRREFGGRGAFQLDARTRLLGEVLQTEDLVNRGRRDGGQIGVDRKFGDRFHLELGYRHAEESTAPASLQTAETPAATPNTTNSLRVKGTEQFGLRASIFAEFEQDLIRTDQRRAALGGDLRLTRHVHLYAHHEFVSSLAGPYALNGAQSEASTVIGINADYIRDGSVFSEYRARDAWSGREAEAAIGLRNGWTLSRGLRLQTTFERVDGIKTKSAAEATAVTGALEYTGSPRWRGTARLEYRNAASRDNLYASLGYARKLSQDWSLLGRSALDVVFHQQLSERSALGVAYRQTARNHWNFLGRYEHQLSWTDSVTGGPRVRREAHIFSTHASFHPSLPWVFSGELAVKFATELSDGIRTPSNAQLVQTRAVYDFTRHWDVGLLLRMLASDGFHQQQGGVGVEVGRVVAKNLRVGAGFNFFGFRDQELTGQSYTDRGLYLLLGWKFDEDLFGVGAPPSAPAAPVVTGAQP